MALVAKQHRLNLSLDLIFLFGITSKVNIGITIINVSLDKYYIGVYKYNARTFPLKRRYKPKMHRGIVSIWYGKRVCAICHVLYIQTVESGINKPECATLIYIHFWNIYLIKANKAFSIIPLTCILLAN